MRVWIETLKKPVSIQLKHLKTTGEGGFALPKKVPKQMVFDLQPCFFAVFDDSKVMFPVADAAC